MNDRFRLFAAGQVGSSGGGCRRYLKRAEVRGEGPLSAGSGRRLGTVASRGLPSLWDGARRGVEAPGFRNSSRATRWVLLRHGHNAKIAKPQGLAVLVFSTVETFVRERTGELLQSFTNPSLGFSDLSPALQRATTVGALEGVRFRLKLQPAVDRVTWLVAKLAPIAGATTNVRNLSDHSFGYSASTIDEEDVREILKSFGVESPWKQLTSLTSRIGIAILDAEAEFDAIRKRRHSSAHALTEKVLYADLLNSVRSSLGICIAFDLLISHARGLFNRRAGPGYSGRPLLRHTDVELVFVGPRPGTTTFAVRNEQLPPPAAALVRPTVRIFPTESAASTYGERYAASRTRQMVVLDGTSLPVKWSTW